MPVSLLLMWSLNQVMEYINTMTFRADYESPLALFSSLHYYTGQEPAMVVLQYLETTDADPGGDSLRTEIMEVLANSSNEQLAYVMADNANAPVNLAFDFRTYLTRVCEVLADARTE